MRTARSYTVSSSVRKDSTQISHTRFSILSSHSTCIGTTLTRSHWDKVLKIHSEPRYGISPRRNPYTHPSSLLSLRQDHSSATESKTRGSWANRVSNSKTDRHHIWCHRKPSWNRRTLRKTLFSQSDSRYRVHRTVQEQNLPIQYTQMDEKTRLRKDMDQHEAGFHWSSSRATWHRHHS